MVDKYYTPEIEEFHVGFECEQKLLEEGAEWKPIRIHCLEMITHVSSCARVKYLDQEDIESLGFTEETDPEKAFCSQWGGSSTLFYKKYYDESRKKELYHWIRCSGSYDGSFQPGDKGVFMMMSQDFRGWVKNKSELKRVLKQIGYGEL